LLIVGGRVEFKVGGLKDEDLSFDPEGMTASVVVPVSMHTFQELEAKKESKDKLDCCLSSRGVVTDGVERIRIYRFEATVLDISRERSGTRVALQMADEPKFETIEL